MDDHAPDLRTSPLSAPAWVWALYLLILFGITFITWPVGVVAVLFTCVFSFQFWSFCSHRGITREFLLYRRGTPVYVLSVTPKSLRETLCVAQTAIGNSETDEHTKRGHLDLLDRLINETDRHRPLGADGTHTDHTESCGCDAIH
jgi:hypothetical protein